MAKHGLPAPGDSPPELLPLSAPAAPRRRRRSRRRRAPEKNFRFFDNRQKYLLFVNTCSEKDVVARRVGLELGHIHPRPPAVRLFDAGMGDGTVLARVMREMHRRFPTVPFYIVGKEISLEDVRLSLRKMADRFFEHPGHGAGRHQHVLHRGAVAHAARGAGRDLDGVARGRAHRHHRRTTSASRSPRSSRSSRRTGRRGISPKTGNPIYEHPTALVLYRDDYRFLLDEVIPKRGAGARRLRHGDRLAALPRCARRSNSRRRRWSRRWCARWARAGACSASIPTATIRASRSSRRCGRARTRSPRRRHDLMRAAKAELGQGGAALQLQRLRRRARAVPLRHAHAAERDLGQHRHLDAVRGLERRDLRRADRRRSACRKCCARRTTSTRRAKCCKSTAASGSSTSRMSSPASATDIGVQARLSELLTGGSLELSPRELHRARRDRRAAAGATPASTFLRCPACRSRARSRRSPRSAPPGSTRCRTFRRGASCDRDEFRDVPEEGGVAARRAPRAAASAATSRAERTVRRQPADPRVRACSRDCGVREIGVAGYPGGPSAHFAQSPGQSLQSKIELAREQGIGVYVVTQFSFSPQRVVDYCSQLARTWPELPVYVGIAGPPTRSRSRATRSAAASASRCARCVTSASASPSSSPTPTPATSSSRWRATSGRAARATWSACTSTASAAPCAPRAGCGR